MTTLFYAVTDCRTDLISLQARTIAAFCPDSALVVVNNAPAGATRSAIEAEARACAARHVAVPTQVQMRTTPNHIHASALVWLWPEIILTDRPDYVVLIDFDMFPIAPFDVPAYLGDAVIGGVPQSRPIGPAPEVFYFWPGLLLMHFAALPEPETINLDCGLVDGVNVDVGGQLHHYLAAHDLITREVSATKSMMCHARLTHADGIEKLPAESRAAYEDEFRCDLLADAHVLHYTGGTGWDYPDPDLVSRKTAWVRRLIEARLSGTWEMP